MTGRTKTKGVVKAEPLNVSPQMWAFNPMLSTVGLAGWAEIVKETVEFVSDRVEKDMRAQRDFLDCRSYEDVLRLQSVYYREAARQYAEQFQRAISLFSNAAALGWSEATASRSRKYDDIPL